MASQLKTWSAVVALSCVLMLVSQPSAAFAPQGTPAPAFKQAATSLNMIFGGRSGGAGGASSAAAKSPAADEAVSVFNAKFARRRKKRPIDETKLRGTFAEMCRLFGEESSSKMVEAAPEVLEMERTYFAQTYEIFCGKFGKDETDALLLRNPAILSVKPDGWGPEGYGGADSAGPETIYLSYVVAATRPLGNYGIAGVIGLLSIPAIEKVTGISIRSAILSSEFLQSQLPGL